MLENKKLEYIEELKQRVKDKIMNEANANFLAKLIMKADSLEEVQAIMAMGTTYKRTGFHFDFRKEPACSNIKYLKKNEKLSFVTDKNALTHKLIIGDNYDALRQLLITHRGKIDVIYIDPPYGKDNMGNFAETNYTNAITRDNLLSMLYVRLQLARDLLSENGVIFCSIDDKNHAYIKCLFDDIFSENNFIADTFVLDNLKGKSNDNFITSVGHKMLVYAKNIKTLVDIGGFNKTENVLGEAIASKYNCEDEKGVYKEISFKKTGQDSLRENRQFSYFPVIVKNEKVFAIEDEEYVKIYNKETDTFDDDFVNELQKKYTNLGYDFILPFKGDGTKLRWTYNFKGFKGLIETNGIIYRNGSLYTKSYATEIELIQTYANGVSKSLFYKKDYANGTLHLADILYKEAFDYPKPVSLLIDILKLIKNKNCIVLDFFAGSGTTGQAVLDLNREDGGSRKFILCTNNEITNVNPNGIAYDVTTKRLKRVMTGKCYDNSSNFDWIKKNKPYGGNLEVTEIAEISPTIADKGKTPFDVIDESLYAVLPFDNKEDKINWICTYFKNTMKGIESDKKYIERWGE